MSSTLECRIYIERGDKIRFKNLESKIINAPQSYPKNVP